MLLLLFVLLTVSSTLGDPQLCPKLKTLQADALHELSMKTARMKETINGDCTLTWNMEIFCDHELQQIVDRVMTTAKSAFLEFRVYGCEDINITLPLSKAASSRCSEAIQTSLLNTAQTCPKTDFIYHRLDQFFIEQRSPYEAAVEHYCASARDGNTCKKQFMDHVDPYFKTPSSYLKQMRDAICLNENHNMCKEITGFSDKFFSTLFG